MKFTEIKLRLYDRGQNETGPSRYRLQCFVDEEGSSKFESGGESIAATIFYAGYELVRTFAIRLNK